MNEPLTLGFGELEQTMSTDGRPTLSVVTASLNQGRYIRDCIESVRAQEDFAVEHIVVDGGSTDETLSILRSYPHLRWTSEPDKGQSDALNKGFARAKGDWILWLNADDFMLPSSFAAAREVIARGPRADVVFGDMVVVDGDGTFVRASTFTPVRHRLKRYFVSLPSTGTFFRRSIFHDHGLWLDTNLSIIMDTDLFSRMDRFPLRFAKVEGALVAFRVHGENVSQKRHALSGAEAAKRWRVHLAERRRVIAKTILPGIPLGGARELWWRCVRSVLHTLYRVDKVVTGARLREMQLNERLADECLRPGRNGKLSSPSEAKP